MELPLVMEAPQHPPSYDPNAKKISIIYYIYISAGNPTTRDTKKIQLFVIYLKLTLTYRVTIKENNHTIIAFLTSSLFFETLEHLSLP